MAQKLLEHKHLIITARTSIAPKDVKQINQWMKELIQKIDMEILMGPYSTYYESPGNVGITSFCIITTSHIGLHTFEEDGNLTQFELDVYSCKDFDVQTIFDHIEQFEPKEISYKFIDRKNNLQVVLSNQES